MAGPFPSGDDVSVVISGDEVEGRDPVAEATPASNACIESNAIRPGGPSNR